MGRLRVAVVHHQLSPLLLDREPRVWVALVQVDQGLTFPGVTLADHGAELVRPKALRQGTEPTACLHA